MISERDTPARGEARVERGQMRGVEICGRNRGTSRTEEECDGIEDVAQDREELQRKLVNAESTTDPGEQVIDHRDKATVSFTLQ